VTTAIEVEIRQDGTMLEVGQRDWQATLLDACRIRLVGQVADETTTWDVYEVKHQDCQVRTYALEL